MAAKGARIPALFIGHGSPMNTLEQNRYVGREGTKPASDTAAASLPRTCPPTRPNT
jgi:aromatic ring-opening dioxygenase catalytic subunit (LigB family)